MLDRIDAGLDGEPHAAVRAGVRRDLHAVRVRLGDHGGDLLLRPVRRRVDVAVGREPQAAGVRVDLHPVGPVRELLADGLAAAVGAVADLDAGRKLPVGAEVRDGVAARRRKGRPDDLHPRAGNDALVHGVAQGHVVVAGALGLEIPQPRESVLEGDLERTHGANDPVRRVLLEDLVVVLGLRGVALQEHVRVRRRSARAAACASRGRGPSRPRGTDFATLSIRSPRITTMGFSIMRPLRTSRSRAARTATSAGSSAGAARETSPASRASPAMGFIGSPRRGFYAQPGGVRAARRARPSPPGRSARPGRPPERRTPTVPPRADA